MSIDRDALLREVDEELRREQFQKLWEQYGTYMIGAVAAVVLGVGGFKWWEARSIAQAERAGQRFEEALTIATQGKAEEASKEFAAIANGSGASYPMLAQLALAGQQVKAGNAGDAAATYEAAASRSSDPLIKDFARLQSVALKIDSADFTEVQNRLNDLIADKNPWRYVARELLGVAALRAGRLDEARNTLAPLSADPRAPVSVRERAGALMSLVVAAEQERGAPGKVEFEKTEDPAPAPATPPAQAEPSRGKAAPGGRGAVKGK